MEKICYCCSKEIIDDIIEGEDNEVFCCEECKADYYAETNDDIDEDIKYDEQKEKEMLKI